MTPVTKALIRWVSDRMSCQKFARLIASGEPIPSGLLGRFDFWTHWVWCPYCRRYWDEIKTLGALHRSAAALKRHPVVKVDDIKQRLKQRLLPKTS